MTERPFTERAPAGKTMNLNAENMQCNFAGYVLFGVDGIQWLSLDEGSDRRSRSLVMLLCDGGPKMQDDFRKRERSGGMKIPQS